MDVYRDLGDVVQFVGALSEEAEVDLRGVGLGEQRTYRLLRGLEVAAVSPEK